MYSAQKACPVLSVQSVDQAVTEYQQYGFTLAKAFGSPAVHAILTNGPAEIHLSGAGNAGQQSVWIVVDDLAKVEQLLSTAVPDDRREPAEDQPHGYRELSIVDRSGNTVVFAQRIESK